MNSLFLGNWRLFVSYSALKIQLRYRTLYLNEFCTSHFFSLLSKHFILLLVLFNFAQSSLLGCSQMLYNGA
jgi:hypothetical protein